MSDVKDKLDSPTRNTTYITVQSVLLVFRRRLTVLQAIELSSVLPAVLRAMFVQDWDIHHPVEPFIAAADQEMKKWLTNFVYGAGGRKNVFDYLAAIKGDAQDLAELQWTAVPNGFRNSSLG